MTIEPVGIQNGVLTADSSIGSSTLYGPYASRPAPGSSGRIYTASDGIVQFVDNGSNWCPLIRGVPGTEVAPGNSMVAFTQVGLLPSNTNTQGGCFWLDRFVVGSNSLCGYEVLKTVGQTVTMHFVPQMHQSGANNTGGVGLPSVWVRDSVSGKLEGMFVGDSGFLNNWTDLNIYTFNTLSSFNGNPLGGGIQPISDGMWLQIHDTGTGILNFNYSFDGVNFIQMYQDAATFLGSGNTGDRYGFGVNANSRAVAMTVDSWKVG